jgi:predicted peptidase
METNQSNGMKKRMLLLIGCISLVALLAAQESAVYEKKYLYCGTDTLPYRLLLPENFDPQQSYPLVLFLHGGGERGNNNESQLLHGSRLFLQAGIRQQFPAIVVFPQCPANTTWSNVRVIMDSVTKERNRYFPEEAEPTYAMMMLMQLMRELNKQFRIKQDQQYVMGLSMGAMGTYEMVKRMPNTFAAAIAICGGANPNNAKWMKHTAFWIFHGDADNVVPVQHSKDMAMALQQFYNGADMQLTIYPGVKHNSWDNAFAEPELLPWLFSHKRN